MGGGWLAWISVGETVAEFRKRSMDARKLRLSRNWGMLSNKFGFTAPGSLDTHLCYAATIPPLRHTVRFRFLDKADDGLRRGTGPSEIGPNRRQQLRVRLPRRRPPPRRPRAQPVVVCPRPPRVERRARARPDLTHPLDAETSPRRRGGRLDSSPM